MAIEATSTWRSLGRFLLDNSDVGRAGCNGTGGTLDVAIESLGGSESTETELVPDGWDSTSAAPPFDAVGVGMTDREVISGSLMAIDDTFTGFILG